MKRKPSKSVGSNRNPLAGQTSPTALETRFRGWRLWLLRLGMCVLSPLLAFSAFELALRLVGYGHPCGFLLRTRIDGQAALVQNDRFTWPYFGRNLARQPFPLAIPEVKSKDAIRVFVLGESAAYGDPQPEFGLARLLEALLSQRYPENRFEVVNAAMTAINSHTIRRIARDCVSRQGDIWVVYMGNNEVVGPFGAGTVFGSRTPNLALVRASLALKETRTGQLLEGMIYRLAKPPPEKREWGGMRMFLERRIRQEDPQMTAVYGHFRRNLEDILDTARRAGAKVVIGTVASNLKDCAPFGSLHRSDLSETDLVRWNALYQQALNAWQAGRFAEAIGPLDQAARIDDTFAELHYLWGVCCLQLGQDTLAANHFIRARDQDVLRFRADSRINQIIEEAAAKHATDGIGLVDGQKVLGERSGHGLAGRECLYEHVHLNFRGNYYLALAFAERIAEQMANLSGGHVPSRPWPSLDQCAARLGWMAHTEQRGTLAMLGRLSEPPFTARLDNAAMVQDLRQRLERLRPSISAAALRQSAQHLQALLKTFPQDWVLLKEQATIQQATKDLAGEVDSWRRILAQMPHYAEGWKELGRSLSEQHHAAEATAAFQQALELEPNSVPASMGLAQCLASQGKPGQAIAVYERVLHLKPYWSPAHLELGKLLQAAGKPGEAERHFRQALESRLLTPPALHALASLCFDKGWLSEACTNLADVVRLDPTDATAHVNLGIALGKLGRRAEAQAQFSEALRLDPGLAEAHVRLGIELGRQGQDANALGHFEEATRLEPALVEARLNLGIALVKQCREAQALVQFQEVLRQHPTNTLALDYMRRLKANQIQ